MSTQESAAPQPLRPEITTVEDNPVFPHSLPTPLMPLVGRVAELQRYSVELADPASRLLTLTGPGGVGKTRLAIALANAVCAEFPHGVVFVPLAEVREVGLLLPAIARALGLPPDEGRTVESFISTVGSLRLLLVLDNLEQLPDAGPELARLLEFCPQLTVLATSRVPLDVRGEHVVSLEPLALPGLDATLAAVEGFEAVAFFLQVAQKHVADFALTDDNRGVVVEICRRLDGLPLGLELAASQLRMFPPATLLRLLEHRLEVLTEGPRDLPDRQRTLRNTIRWSYDLLSPEDRAHFRRLGVFVGGFTLETAMEVVGLQEGEAIGAIRRLVDHHLVRPILADSGRFRMLETIREFALEVLDDAGERRSGEIAHAAWCRDLAAAAAPRLACADQGAWLDRLDADLENLRAAMTWGNEHAPRVALQIASSLWRFWIARGRVREGQEWVRRALQAAATDASSVERAAGLYASGELAEALMELPEAGDFYTQSQAIYVEAGDAAGIARCLNGRGTVARAQGRLDEAEHLHQEALQHLAHAEDRRETAVAYNALGAVAYYRGDSAGAENAWEQALAIAREIGDTRGMGMVTGNLGAVALQRGDPARAASLHEQNLQLCRTMRDPSGIARSLINLGSALTEAGDLAQAREHLENGLNLARDIDETGLVPVALYTLGRGALLSRDYADAARWFSESMVPMARVGHLPGVATALEGLGCVASQVAWHEDAVRLFCAADQVREETGAAQEGDDPGLEEARATSRGAVGPGACRALAEQARHLVIDEIVAGAGDLAARIVTEAARIVAPAPETPSRFLARQYGLTRREIEILRYVVDHRSDKEIGDVLFISPRTVGTHVTSVRNKMGVGSRREAARIADEMGLGDEP